MARKRYNEDYEYEIFEDGYDIYFQGMLQITQRAPYNKIILPQGTDEENAIKQLDELTAPQNKAPSPLDLKNEADLAYLALMLDMELPSESEE